MINCEKATFLMDKGQMTKLSFGERIKLKMHRAICKLCQCYESDSVILSRILKKSGKQHDCLSKDEKEKIKSSLDQI